jgi:hypothetical protein
VFIVSVSQERPREATRQETGRGRERWGRERGREIKRGREKRNGERMRQRDSNRQRETDRVRDRLNKREIERYAWLAYFVPLAGSPQARARLSLLPHQVSVPRSWSLK